MNSEKVTIYLVDWDNQLFFNFDGIYYFNIF